ncbi:hypothetical protein HO133_003952 [Letharia lupina]|uniref:Uncharacterized protein n=1 Tax=Letharia lupina TaxID=560253 RepID=A0A8H6F8V7_9LECA|nr:uncharacterized protein HO133_003952 [Letharia lupina]KAF6219485.1 hypothetical protein HO133_003952 [Letharia lupina]
MDQLPIQPATQPAIHSVTQSDILQEEEQYSIERIAETVSSSSDTTGLLSTISHQSTQSATQSATQPDTQQEKKSLQQANAENTTENTAENPAEKSSGSKAPIVKNIAQLSTIPRQIATQQAENTTTIWPIIPTALIWYITAMSTQEEDLLRRSQPSHYNHGN